MKKMKKLAAMLIAVVMAMSLAVPAMAEETGGTITVTGTSDTVYTIYKMFDITQVNGGYTYNAATDSDWIKFDEDDNFPNVSNYITIDEDGYVYWKKATVSAADGAALAELARAYVKSKAITSDVTVKVGNSISLTENGYYLLVPNNDSASGVQVVYGGEPVTMTEKVAAPGLPNVEKKVQEDSTNAYGDANTVDIGQTVSFQTTISAAAHASNYVLHDTLDQSFQLNKDSFSVTKNGTPVSAGDDYTVVTNEPTDGCSFHVKFSDSFCSSLAKNDKILVSYTADFNPGKTIPPLGSDEITAHAHENTTWLTHTDENIKTNVDSTSTYTYRIDVTKTDGTNPLAGAGFVLKDKDNKYYKQDASTGAVTWVDSISGATELKTTNSSHVVTFFGIDAENYTLIENTVPGGYIGQTDMNISTINDTLGKNNALTVVNTLGTQLPETGGMGTTIFYIAGSILMLGAAVLLITKKRTKAE